MNNEEMKLNEEKISEAFNKNIKLHIVLRNNSWRNGFVKEITPSYFIFNDFENGPEPIFFLEVYKVEPFTEK